MDNHIKKILEALESAQSLLNENMTSEIFEAMSEDQKEEFERLKKDADISNIKKKAQKIINSINI